MKHVSHERRFSFEKWGMKGQQVGSPVIKLKKPKLVHPFDPKQEIKKVSLTPRTWNRNKYQPKITSKARRINK